MAGIRQLITSQSSPPFQVQLIVRTYARLSQGVITLSTTYTSSAVGQNLLLETWHPEMIFPSWDQSSANYDKRVG